jgi:glucose-6-phosphate 1-dehydrogenase
VETFVALRLQIETWRWSGVPFYIRAGKGLPVTATEVMVELKQPPQRLFDDGQARPPNYFRFRLEPDVSISLGARTKASGTSMSGKDVELVVHDPIEDDMTPYERLLGDALRGDHELFTRDDCVEAAWRIVEPVVRNPPPVFEYDAGSWGPVQARDVIEGSRGWHDPS